MFTYIWEYHIKTACVQEFETAYGPAGTWVELFRQTTGYIRTELHQDRRQKNRYLTIDYWESAKAYQAFQQQFATQFETLNKQCDQWTHKEVHIGDFNEISLD